MYISIKSDLKILLKLKNVPFSLFHTPFFLNPEFSQREKGIISIRMFALKACSQLHTCVKISRNYFIFHLL